VQSIKKLNLSVFVKLSFFLFPFFIISGHFLPDLFVTVVSILFLVFYLKFSYKNIFSNYLFLFLIIFYFYFNINSLLSDYPSISLETSVPYIRFIIFPFAVFFLLSCIKDLKKTIFLSLCIAYLFLLIDSILQLTYGHNILGLKLSATDRVSSFFGSKLVMGSFVARCLPIVLAISFIEKLKYKKSIQVFLLIIAGILIFFSGERLASAYYLIIVTFYFFLNFNKKYFIFIIFGFFIFFSSLFFLKPSSLKRLIFSTIEQSRQTRSIFFFSYRHELHFLTAYNMYKDSKFLGHGTKSFRYLCDNEKYVPLKKIENDNKIYSLVEGHIYFSIPNQEKVIYAKVIPNNEYDKNTYSYSIYVGEFYKIYKNEGDFVKKNEPIASAYEFKNGCNTHPHNVHLQFLSELGIFGYIFLFFSFIFLSFRIFLIIVKYFNNKSLNNDDFFKLFISLGLLLSIFPLFPSGSFFNNWLSVIFYYNLAFLVNYSNKSI